MKILSILIIPLYLGIYGGASIPTTQPFPWNGWKVSMSGGAFGTFWPIRPNEKTPTTGPCFEVGAEYGRTFGGDHQYYIGGNIIFNAFIPDSFKLSAITLFGSNIKLYPIFCPIFDILFGYNWDNNQLIIGSTYLWGVTLGYRYALSPNMYVSLKAVWWADRILFDTGLHDGYATIGVGYSF